jgi:hypothetical protein
MKSKPCPKAGVKIHEYPNSNAYNQMVPFSGRMSSSAPLPASTSRTSVSVYLQPPPPPPQNSDRFPKSSKQYLPHQQQQHQHQHQQHQQQQQQQQQQQHQQHQHQQQHQQQPNQFYTMDDHLSHHQQQILHHEQQMKYHQELINKYKPAHSAQQPPQQQLVPHGKSYSQQQQQQTQQQLVPHAAYHPTQKQQQLVPHATYPTQQKQPQSLFDSLDLNLDNYELNDILKLFNIKDANLSEDVMKRAKKEMLKLHPDKCQNKVDPKYYEFFKKAYRYLEQIYDFQNRADKKNRNTSYSSSDMYEEDNAQIVKDFMTKQGGNGFNSKVFNEQFEKYYIKDEATAKGYDDWLKGNDGIIDQPQGKISLSAMGSHIETYKKENNALMKYTGVADHIYTGTAAGGTLLNLGQIDNFSGTTSGDVFGGRGLVYTDLKQAFTETLIPVCESDYDNVKKYRNAEEYMTARDIDAKTYKVMSEEESDSYLRQQEQKQGQEGAHVAFQFAKQSEKIKEAQTGFWSNLKQLAYGN